MKTIKRVTTFQAEPIFSENIALPNYAVFVSYTTAIESGHHYFLKLSGHSKCTHPEVGWARAHSDPPMAMPLPRY